MQSTAINVESYLAELPEDRRAALSAVRQVILANLPAGYEEVMSWGMIAYQVPLQEYPDTYNGKPLMYAALASQKNYMSVYLMGIYTNETARQKFESAYRAMGKRFDAGKPACASRTWMTCPWTWSGSRLPNLECRITSAWQRKQGRGVRVGESNNKPGQSSHQRLTTKPPS